MSLHKRISVSTVAAIAVMAVALILIVSLASKPVHIVNTGQGNTSLATGMPPEPSGESPFGTWQCDNPSSLSSAATKAQQLFFRQHSFHFIDSVEEVTSINQPTDQKASDLEVDYDTSRCVFTVLAILSEPGVHIPGLPAGEALVPANVVPDVYNVPVTFVQSGAKFMPGPNVECDAIQPPELVVDSAHVTQVTVDCSQLLQLNG